MVKRIISTLLVLIINASFIQAYAVEDTIGKFVLPAITVGEFIEDYTTQVAATSMVNGCNYMYTCIRGSAGVLNVINLETNTLVAAHEIPGFYAWEMKVDSTGMVWMTGFAKLIKYDPFNDSVTNYGTVLYGESASFGLCIDNENNVYVGTYPNARIAKFNPTTESFTDLGVIHSGASYVRSIAYLNGYIYAGTFSNTDRKFIKINKNNFSDKTEIVMQNSYIANSDIDWIYYMTAAGKYVFSTIWLKNSDNQNRPAEMLIYDTELNKFIDYNFENKTGGSVSEPYNGKVYFYNQAYVYSFDLTTEAIENTGISDVSVLIKPTSKFITLNNNSKYPNPVLFSVYGSQPAYIDITAKTMAVISVQRVSGYNSLSNVYTVGDEIILSPVGSGSGVAYNIFTKEKRSIATGGQAEGMLKVGNKLYIGGYPGAYLYRTDIATGAVENLGRIAESQSRPFALAEGNGKLYIGTMPEYGELGGVIATYDIATNTMTSQRNLIPDQSILNLIYKDGLVYGSTGIGGGAGSVPTQTNAKIFVYDPASETILRSFTPSIPGMTTVPRIRGLAFDNNGRLWASAGYNIFTINTNTGEISNLINFGTDISAKDSPTQLIVSGNLLYANLDGLKIINLTDYTYKDCSDYTKNGERMTLGADGNIYFISPFYTPYTAFSKLMMVPVSDTEIFENDLETVRKLIWDNGFYTLSNENISAALSEYNLTAGEQSALTVYLKYYLKEDLLEKTTFDKRTLDYNALDTLSKSSFTLSGTAITTQDTAYSNGFCFKIFDNSVNVSGVESNLIEVDRRNNYHFSYRQKINSGRLYLDILFYDANKTLLGTNTIINIVGKGRWTLIEGEVPISNYPTAKYIKLFFNKPKYFKGEGYIDDIYLLKQAKGDPAISSVQNAFTVNGSVTISGQTITGPLGLIGGKVEKGEKSKIVKEYGAVFSKSDSLPEIGKLNCIKVKANKSKNIYGKYGILFYGNGILSGKNYYTRPYVIYEKDGSDIIQYGETICFDIVKLQKWLVDNELFETMITEYMIN